MAKHWTPEQIEYLTETWGEKPIPSIARDLGKSINAVRLKANRLGLGPHIHSGEYITLNQLIIALRGRKYHDGDLKSYVIRRGLPVRRKKIIKHYYRVVYLDDFWVWAEQNRDFIDFSKLERGILGKEPEWIEEQRRADELYALYGGKAKKKWTPEEDALLISMVKSYRYTYQEISARLMRTESAIRRRLYKLGTKYRPITTDARPWTIDEIRTLLDMHIKGYKPEVIAEHVSRSATAIRGKIDAMQRKGLLKGA